MLVFGLRESQTRWLALRLREHSVNAVSVPADLPPSAAQAVCSAADAGVHLMSAAQGLDGTFLEYWQMLAEAGKSRFVAVAELGPAALDVNEAAAIASRVLEEEVLPTTLPLLDDDEAVIGVLDVLTGEQWFPTGEVQPARDDFSDAVAAETNTWFDEADAVGTEPEQALREGLLAAAVTVDGTSAAGVVWLAAHVPGRRPPLVTTVLPGDHPDLRIVTAGPDGLTLGAATTLVGTRTVRVRIESLTGLLAPDLRPRLEPGEVAAARIAPVPEIGSLLLGG